MKIKFRWHNDQPSKIKMVESGLKKFYEETLEPAIVPVSRKSDLF